MRDTRRSSTCQNCGKRVYRLVAEPGWTWRHVFDDSVACRLFATPRGRKK